ncbi:MAG: hypothetical protein LUQ50_10520, partial [Methanospirillum sp.]|uniref:hypothetical protein n=1 Tax=Methanospirillum sp. TaxID=45200 RepID=UPI0023713493
MPDVESEQKPQFRNASPARYQIKGSQAQVLISTNSGTISEYQVHEPELSPELIQACSALRVQIKQLLHDKQAYHRLSRNFSREFTRITKERFPSFTAKEIEKLAYFINRDARGLGKIQPLVEDPAVQLISITGPKQIITLQHVEHGLLFTSLILSEAEISQLIKKLCNRATKQVSNSSPPHEITLRSGLLVKFSETQGDSGTRSILIEKPDRVLDIPSSSHSPS